MRLAGCSRLVALHVDVDLAAARQPDVPRLLVGDAEVQQPRSAAAEHFLGDLDDRALDTAAGHGAGDLAVLVDGHLRARRARRGTLHADHRRERHRVTASGPGIHVFEYVLHDSPSSMSEASASSEAIEFPGSRWST